MCQKMIYINNYIDLVTMNPWKTYNWISSSENYTLETYIRNREYKTITKGHDIGSGKMRTFRESDWMDSDHPLDNITETLSSGAGTRTSSLIKFDIVEHFKDGILKDAEIVKRYFPIKRSINFIIQFQDDREVWLIYKEGLFYIYICGPQSLSEFQVHLSLYVVRTLNVYSWGIDQFIKDKDSKPDDPVYTEIMNWAYIETKDIMIGKFVEVLTMLPLSLVRLFCDYYM